LELLAQPMDCNDLGSSATSDVFQAAWRGRDGGFAETCTRLSQPIGIGRTHKFWVLQQHG
jgi:hypothetical protein